MISIQYIPIEENEQVTETEAEEEEEIEEEWEGQVEEEEPETEEYSELLEQDEQDAEDVIKKEYIPGDILEQRELIKPKEDTKFNKISAFRAK